MTEEFANPAEEQHPPTRPHVSNLAIGLSALAAGLIYFFSNPKANHFYDYTFRVAANMLTGRIGFDEPQPSWLNEFVPYDGLYYSVFPLGSVLTMIPFAVFKAVGLITDMPSSLIIAIIAASACALMMLIARRYDVSATRIYVLTAAFLFGTWTWTNITFGGAWQLALGFALIGQLGAIYFTVFYKRPLLAGAFFALAFGNRTEVLLVAPILMWLLVRDESRVGSIEAAIKRVAVFCVVPFILGVSTLIYNYVRFDSFTDFGYSRIPGVLDEPWYRYGIFSVWYIPGQIYEMLFKFWETRNHFPFPIPNGFSASILISSPFVLLAARQGSRDRVLKYLSWAAILVLCIVLWMHGNAGGWQFAYRYAIVCLPWLFMIMLESAPKRVSVAEWALISFSIAANAYATWLFHWTEHIKP